VCSSNRKTSRLPEGRSLTSTPKYLLSTFPKDVMWTKKRLFGRSSSGLTSPRNYGPSANSDSCISILYLQTFRPMPVSMEAILRNLLVIGTDFYREKGGERRFRVLFWRLKEARQRTNWTLCFDPKTRPTRNQKRPRPQTRHLQNSRTTFAGVPGPHRR
jgi:hypothetical protein